MGIDKNTIKQYVRILEQAFVIFRLSPFSRNQRNELKKLRKIYFYDNGIRNALINNFNPLTMRKDVGELWENYLIAERIKKYSTHTIKPNQYFWRHHNGQEIDYIEQQNDDLQAYEFKWKAPNRFKVPSQFATHYPEATVNCIHRENYTEFIG